MLATSAMSERQQLELFDGLCRNVTEAPRLHRADDHPNSVSAAERMTGERLTRAQQRALDAVRQYPGKTRNELNRLAAPVNSPEAISKRLRELERAELIVEGETRRCSITGENCATWFAK